MKRLAALSLTLALSTPAAAATISLTDSQTWYRAEGTSTEGFHIDLATTIPGLPTLEPANGDLAKRGGYEFWIADFYVASGVADAGTIFKTGCFDNYSSFCDRESGSPGERPVLHVGDFARFDYFWFPYGVLAGLPKPEALIDVGVLPEGVSLVASQSPYTVSPVPLPASWLLFASMLGLGGLVRRWRRA